MSLVVDLVIDRRADDPACAELQRRVAEAFTRAIVRLTFVAPGDTLAAAHRVAQLAGEAGPDDRVVAHDVAAGADQPGPWPAGAGERLLVARSAAGVLVMGSNVGWTWSRVVADLQSLHVLDVPATDQRSRPARLGTAIVHAGRGHPHAIAGTVPRTQVPALPERIAIAPRVAVERVSRR
jgi:hypothetical protein